MTGSRKKSCHHHALAWLSALGLVLPGCATEQKESVGKNLANRASASIQPAPGGHAALPSKPVVMAANRSTVIANELGLVPVLEYHRIGPKEERWTRTPANFRADLQFLYNNDYVLVNMRDVAARRLDIPAGKKPVVLTFDDSTAGQFRYQKNAKGQIARDAAGQARIDPDCAVGVLDQFAKKYPEFGSKATFYVLPSGFDQDGVIDEKFRYLAKTGRELGNHTWAHDNMARMSPAAAEAAVSRLQTFVSARVGSAYPMTTLALPFGIGPQARNAFQKVVSGGQGDGRYHHAAILLVGANPARSPWDKRYDPTAVPRIQCIDSEFRNWFNRAPGSTKRVKEPWQPYISDGNAKTVAYPMALAPHLNRAVLPSGVKALPMGANTVHIQVFADSVAPARPTTVLAEAQAPVAMMRLGSIKAPAFQVSSQHMPSQPGPFAPGANPDKKTAGAATKQHPDWNFHMGYQERLPRGGEWKNGKLTHTVSAGDSVEAIAWRYARYTDYYTWSKLVSGIRATNGGGRALRIGERLSIPRARHVPPKATLVARNRDFEARGVYVTGTIAGSEGVWDIVKKLKAHGDNTVVFDAKDMDGRVTYNTQVPLAKAIHAYRGDMIRELPKFVARLHDENIHVVARLALFHDSHLARSRSAYTLRSKRSGKPWLEVGDLGWVDPSLKAVQDYNLALARELIDYGVDEIQFDYVRFPAQGDTADIVWSTMNQQKNKHEVITAWLKRAYEALHPTGVLVSADVYGVVAWDQGIDVRITGQRLEDMGRYLDAISPMLYPSHFYRDFDRLAYPPDHPEHFVSEGIKKTARKTVGTKLTIRPWLQAFPYRIRNYGPEYVARQLRANRDAKGVGYLLWNAENNYQVGFAGIQAFGAKAQKK